VKISAHCPASGVKVKVKVPGVDVFITTGFHDPVIVGLLVDVPGKISGVSPIQYGPRGSNVGIAGFSMVIVIVAVSAQIPASGVKVKVKVPGVDVLITAGFQEPEIGGVLVDVPGNISGVSPLQ